MHLVSVVQGKLAKGFDRIDALIACFPAGTVSGAPKVRAMEIISELEGSRRGIYAGAVGYLDFSGNLDLHKQFIKPSNIFMLCSGLLPNFVNIDLNLLELIR